MTKAELIEKLKDTPDDTQIYIEHKPHSNMWEQIQRVKKVENYTLLTTYVMEQLNPDGTRTEI